MGKENVILGVMTKNESENVLNMLNSVDGLYSAVVWGFDSKTEDETKEIVLNYFHDKDDISQVFYDFDWRNDFSYARNLYLQLALEKFPEKPWILIMDGDDILSPGDPSRGIPDSRDHINMVTSMKDDQFPYLGVNFYVYLDPDAYGIPTLFYPRLHLARNNPSVRWQFASHNAITIDGEKQVLLRECVILHSQKPKKRAEREVQRVEMNIPNLAEQGAGGTSADHVRGYFYLGNTLLDAGDLAGAEQAFMQYLELSTWYDERYQARLHLATGYLIQGQHAQAAEQAKLALVEPGQWARSEAYMVLSDTALFRGDTMEAIHWIRVATQCRPQINGLFLQGHLYTWFPHWRLAAIFDRIGMYREALAHAELAAQWRPDAEILGGIAVLRDYIASLEARGIAIPDLSEVDTNVPIYPISEAQAMARLGVKTGG